MAGVSHRAVRFGVFEVDLDRAELRKQGLRVRLQDQPFQVLAALLERPGEVVGREELIRRLWPDGTVVDFDRGLNAAVTRLRQALSDAADTPRYIETVARHGYRFVGFVEKASGSPHAAAAEDPAIPARADVRVPGRRRAWAAATAIVALAAAGALWLWSRSQHREFGSSMKVILLTGEGGRERNPSFSPDGTLVVYEWEREMGSRHLYLKAVGSGDPTPLTSGAGVEFGPAWSPDGKSIAFIGQETPTSPFGVFVIAPVGGVARRVTEVAIFPWSILNRPYRRLDWMPDSRHLVVSAFGRPPGWECLMLVSIDSGEKTWLTGPASDTMSGDREPAVSPDGTIAFARGPLGNETLHLLRLGADFKPSGAALPVSAAGPARSPAWMPNGRQLIFTTLKPGLMSGFSLSWIDLDSGKPPRHLAALGNLAATPTVSRQGRLAYSTVSGEGNIWRQDIPTGDERVSPAVKVIESATIHLNPEYSPDGTRIAVASERSGAREIWNCDDQGTHCIQLSSFNNSNTGMPRWSPDGKQIVFESMVEGDWNLYIVDAIGGAPRRIHHDGPHGGFPSWSHDPKWIYYSTHGMGTLQTWRVPVLGGGAVQVTRNGGIQSVDSSDSKTLYYLRGVTDGRLFRSAADGSGETELLRGVANWSFVVAGDRIYYLHETSGGGNEIRRFLLATGEDSLVATIDKPLMPGLSVSPDGKSLLYAELRRRGNVMLADGVH